MSDGSRINLNTTSGDFIYTFDDGTYKWQGMLMAFKVGSTPTVVTSAAPLPVTVNAVALGNTANDLGKAIDTAAGATDRGVVSLVMRKDTPATLTPADGDWTTLLVNSKGQLHAICEITNALSGLQDNSAFTIGTTQVLPAGFLIDDTSPASGTEGAGSIARMTITRKQIVAPYEAESLHWQYAAVAGGLVGTSDTAAKTAAGAGLRNYVTSVDVTNSHPTIGTEVVIKDGSTVIHRGYAAAAGGGYAINFATPLKGTANTAINVAEITATATTGVLVNLRGYVGA